MGYLQNCNTSAWRTTPATRRSLWSARPGVLECGGCEGRSAPSRYRWYVWNRGL